MPKPLTNTDLNSRVKRLRELADDTETVAAEWIRHNPHVALLYALHAHSNHWYGCHCELDSHIASAELVTAAGLQNWEKP